MPRGKQYPPEVKAAVVADIMAGESAATAGAKHGVSTSRAREWYLQVGNVNGRQLARAETIGDLATRLLAESLTTLSVQLVAFRDEAWLKRQNAADVAVLYGVLADKAVRLLAAAEPAEGPDEPGEYLDTTATPDPPGG